MKVPGLLSCALLLLTVALFPAVALALDNGLGLKPALGFNTWNAFGTRIDEVQMREMADLLVKEGFLKAGYQYLNLDDAWADNSRASNGSLVAHPRRFASGISHLADYVHSKGLKLGIYGDAGYLTCAGFPGSRGHEAADAAVWASWGVDYLKYDNCWADKRDFVVGRFKAMQDALNRTGRPIMFAMCEWGVADPWLWAPRVGNSWRTTADIKATWEDVLRCLDNNIGLARFAGPGAWNDPDMLEVGNGALTLPEQRAHFALWAFMKAPLLIGTDLRAASSEVKTILLAKEVLAVNQDELGVAADLVWKQGSNEVHAGPLADGSRAVALFNRHHPEYPLNNITVHWRQLGCKSSAKATVRDLYKKKDLGSFAGSFTGEVEAHGVLALRITPAQKSDCSNKWRPWSDDATQAADQADTHEATQEAKNIYLKGLTKQSRWVPIGSKRSRPTGHGTGGTRSSRRRSRRRDGGSGRLQQSDRAGASVEGTV